MEIKFIDYLNEDLINVVVIVSKHQNQWLLCQHKQRNTLEFPGGKREKGEKRQKRRKAGICHCPGAERHGKAGSGSFEKSRRKSIYFIGAGH